MFEALSVDDPQPLVGTRQPAFKRVAFNGFACLALAIFGCVVGAFRVFTSRPPPPPPTRTTAAAAAATRLEARARPKTTSIKTTLRGASCAYTMQDLRNGKSGLPVYIFGTTDAKGKKRIAQMNSDCEEQGLKCSPLPMIAGSKLLALNQESIYMWAAFLQTQYEVALAVEDDTRFIPKLMTELAKTVADLPESMQVLHLCPGALYGRKMTWVCPHHFKCNAEKHFSLDPEGRLTGNTTKTPNGRAFLKWPSSDSIKKDAIFHGSQYECPNVDARRIFTGGPAAYLMTRSGAQDLLQQLRDRMLYEPQVPIDVFLGDTGACREDQHFMSASPQMCMEKSCFLSGEAWCREEP